MSPVQSVNHVSGMDLDFNGAQGRNRTTDTRIFSLQTTCSWIILGHPYCSDFIAYISDKLPNSHSKLSGIFLEIPCTVTQELHIPPIAPSLCFAVVRNRPQPPLSTLL